MLATNCGPVLLRFLLASDRVGARERFCDFSLMVLAEGKVASLLVLAEGVFSGGACRRCLLCGLGAGVFSGGAGTGTRPAGLAWVP